VINKLTSEELLSLGIKKTTSPGRGRESTTAYIYKCHTCGNPVKMFSIFLDKVVYCNLCKTDAKKRIAMAKRNADRQIAELNGLNIVDEKKKQRFINAANIVRKYGDYESAITKAETSYDKYDSIPEAITAIILLNAGYSVIAQQNIAGLRLDFVLPKKKTVIEVDGALYHNQDKQAIRDYIIKHKLGADWDIIHLPADDVKKSPKSFEKMIKKRLNLK